MPAIAAPGPANAPTAPKALNLAAAPETEPCCPTSAPDVECETAPLARAALPAMVALPADKAPVLACARNRLAVPATLLP